MKRNKLILYCFLCFHCLVYSEWRRYCLVHPVQPCTHVVAVPQSFVPEYIMIWATEVQPVISCKILRCIYGFVRTNLTRRCIWNYSGSFLPLVCRDEHQQNQCCDKQRSSGFNYTLYLSTDTPVPSSFHLWPDRCSTPYWENCILNSILFTQTHIHTQASSNISPYPPAEPAFFSMTFIFIRALGIWLNPIWSVN